MQNGYIIIDGKAYQRKGRMLIKSPVTVETGRIELFYSSGVPYGSMEIRNFGKYPVRFQNGKTLMPWESWHLGVEDMNEIQGDELAYTYIKTGITPTDNSTSPYAAKEFALEVNGWNFSLCPCKKSC